MEIQYFCIDVDGVLTDGAFEYTSKGKFSKRFGPDDADALALARSFLEIHFVTADSRGYEISRVRVEEDMGFPLSLVPARARASWMTEMWDIGKVAYMGDSFSDRQALVAAAYGIAPGNCSQFIHDVVDYRTEATGGNRAVAEACIHLAYLLGHAKLFGL